MAEAGNSGEHSVALKTLDEKALEKVELVNLVEERLSNLNSITKGDRTNPAMPGKSTPELDDEVEDDVEVEDKEVVDEKVDEVQADKDDITQDKDKVVIPDAYIRAALHNKWEQKAIDEMIETNPDMALRTLTNIYQSTNNISKQWSDWGRVQAEQKKIQTQVVQPKQVESTGLSDEQIKKIKEQYSGDSDISALLDAVIVPLNQQNKQMADLLSKNASQPSQSNEQRLAVETRRAETSADMAIELQFENFFSSDNLKPYQKFYGDLNIGQNWNDLSAGQRDARWRVLEEADCMIAGSSMQGYKLSTQEALERAHLVVTEPVRERIIRDEIKATATKRKKSFVVRPSDSKKAGGNATDSSGKPKTKEELLQQTEAKLRKVFGN